MFRSATVKLTAWYVGIIMVISLMFSITIYRAASSELEARLSTFSQRVESQSFTWPAEFSLELIQANQAEVARGNLIASLVYVNIIVLAAAGIASFLLAKRTLRPIEKAHERETRFVSDASHELRTPLTAMKTELEVALRDPKLRKDEMREILESNLEEVDNLHQLSNTLLSLSKGEEAKLSFTKESINTLLKKSIKRYKQPGRKIILQEPKQTISARVNAASISELFGILLENALKYSPESSPVNIELRRSGEMVEIDIRNEGDGIGADDLPRVFDRFFQADNARASGGHGLGLSLAKKIAQLHDGSISITSSEGGKTCATVSIPSNRKQSTTAPKS